MEAHSISLLPIGAVEQRVGRRKSSIYADAAAGTFPRPLKIGNRNLWPSNEIDGWVSQRIAEAQAVAA